MELWIRSQDGNILAKPTSLSMEMLSGNATIQAPRTETDDWILGVYPDEATAVAVMDELVERMQELRMAQWEHPEHAAIIEKRLAHVIDLAEIEKAVKDGKAQ